MVTHYCIVITFEKDCFKPKLLDSLVQMWDSNNEVDDDFGLFGGTSLKCCVFCGSSRNPVL